LGGGGGRIIIPSGFSLGLSTFISSLSLLSLGPDALVVLAAFHGTLQL